MKCSQIRKMISPYVDNELAPDELKLFTSHIQECPACKEELEEIQYVHQLFASAERFEAPFGFATRVMAHLEEAEEAGLFSRLWRLLTSRPVFLRTVEVAFALVIMLIGDDLGEYAGRRQDIRYRDIRNADGRKRNLFSRPVSGNASRFDRRRLRETGGGLNDER